MRISFHLSLRCAPIFIFLHFPMKSVVILLISLIAALSSAAQTPSVVRSITASGRNKVVQPAKLTQMLLPSARSSVSNADDAANEDLSVTSTSKGAGFRIQIYSDSNSETAKNSARAKAANISSKFPEYRTYVTYNSPYWRLRVGDFRTREEAAEVADMLKHSFPSYAKEIRVVHDRINIQR